MEKLSRITLIGFLIVIALIATMLWRMPITNTGDVSLSLGGGGDVNYYQQFSGVIASTTALKSIPGAFSGVTINEAAAVAVTFYDATSTTAYSIANGTTLAIFEAAQVEGTYTYNAGLSKGLVMSCDGFTFAGDWTVLYN